MSIMSLLLAGGGGITYGPTPTIDGSGSGSSSSTFTVAGALTTTKTNNIIVAIISIEGSTGVTINSITSVTATGLTFTRYTGQVHNSTASSGYAVLQDIWYATATNVLTGITVTASSSVTFDDATIVLFGVNGCNLSSPFDTGTNMPVKTTFASGSTTKTVTGINTNSNNPLLIASWYTNINNALNTLDTGYTQIQYVTNSGAIKYMWNFVEYKGISGAAQSGVTVTGASTTSTDVWGAIVFAMTG